MSVPNKGPEPKIKPEKEVRFKSDRTQRVDLETFAQTRPSTMVSDSMATQAQQKIKKKGDNSGKTAVKKDKLSDYALSDNRQELILPGFGSPGSNPRVPEYIQQKLPPGVRLGNVTALNTDQHRFYSFNRRLVARFFPVWANTVSRALYNWIKENNASPISKTWVTNVEVIMNDKGEILDVQPMRLSGFWNIDEAAIDGFKQVKNVPNPPKEMIDENGYIHLQYQTEVIWVPQPGVRFTGGN